MKSRKHKKKDAPSSTDLVTESMLRGARRAGNSPLPIEVKTYGTAQSFDSEGDMYEAITGRRSDVLDAEK